MLGCGLLAVAILSFAPATWAQEALGSTVQAPSDPEEDQAADATPSRTRWAVGASQGIGVEINSSREIDVTTLWLRISRILGGPETATGVNTFLGGQPAFAIELTPLDYFRQVPEAWGAGVNFVYEHRLRPQHAFRPTIRAGAGTLYTNQPVPPGETRYNFSLFVGAGVEFTVSGSKAIQLDYRLHHISNADTGAENPGINAHTIVMGFAWGF